MKSEQIISQLKQFSNPENVKGMAQFGIKGGNILGISMPKIRNIAKVINKDSSNRHKLALELWNSGIHEAQILAGLIDEPKKVTEEQMEQWVADFDSWDVCDQVCMNLFDKTSMAYSKVAEWSSREEEFVRRAAFALIACLAVHDKKAEDVKFEHFFPLIIAHSGDDRNFVKKAVNWALRQIGKRNKKLNIKALLVAEKILKKGDASSRWIANDALRELKSEKVQGKFI